MTVKLDGKVKVRWAMEFYVCLWTAIEDGMRLRRQLLHLVTSTEAVPTSSRAQPATSTKGWAVSVDIAAGFATTLILNNEHR